MIASSPGPSQRAWYTPTAHARAKHAASAIRNICGSYNLRATVLRGQIICLPHGLNHLPRVWRES